MKKLRNLLLVVLVFSLLTSVVAVFASAASTSTSTYGDLVNPTIMAAKGGAKAIVTLTFDDGDYKSAVEINKLLKKYDLKASLMMITKYLTTTNGTTHPDRDTWRELFAEGYLEPQSHSTNHYQISSSSSEYNTDAILTEEIVGSRDYLKNAFPTHDIITFSVPYSGYTTAAKTKMQATYYAARMGYCPLATSDTAIKNVYTVQSLNPATGTGYGSWYNPYMVRFQADNASYAGVDLMDRIYTYLNNCVDNGGWFLSLTHEVNYPGKASYDLTTDTLDEFLRVVEGYVEEGLVWSATYSEAVKYLREKQNSTVSIAEDANKNLALSIKMNATTSDGLSLAATNVSGDAIFDYPLTVRVNVPDGWTRVKYELDGEVCYADTFAVQSRTYADVEIIPSAGKTVTSTLSNGSYITAPAGLGEFATDTTVYDMLSDATGGSFSHPYIYANQSEFDSMRAKYLSGSDEVFNSYIADIKARADKFIVKFAGVSQTDIDSGVFNSLGKQPINENGTGHGYDSSGGRLNNLSAELSNDGGSGGLAAILPDAAFLYQVTGNQFYADFALAWSLGIIDNFEHWGPGHYLNAGNTTSHFALSYDWLYNYYASVDADGLKTIRNAIYEKGVSEGYLSVNNLYTYYSSPYVACTQSIYHKMTNNWNPVCTHGMISGSLAIMNDFDPNEDYSYNARYFVSKTNAEAHRSKVLSTGSYPASSTGMSTVTYTAADIQSQAIYIINDNIYYLGAYGLNCFNEDGAYPESSGYWEGACRDLYGVISMLDSTLGDDFGYMDVPALAKTAYYGLHMESSDYNSWPYHDDSERPLQHMWYYYIATKVNDPALVYLHTEELKSDKKNAFMWDVFFYDSANAVGSLKTELPLDNAMDSIDGYVSRSGWTPGSLYVGIMGGDNSAPHGHIDSGNWIYDNGGIRWFADLGMDTYNYFTGDYTDENGETKNVSTYNYYKKGAEGQNTLVLAGHPDTIPFGLNKYATHGDDGYLIDYGSNESGSYAVIDNFDMYTAGYNYDTKTAFYNPYAISAYRGMLLTNDRSTVVIQDEVKTFEEETFWWFAHFNTQKVPYVTISEDGRTAYMQAVNSDGEVKKLRVTLVSDNAELKFEIMDTFTFVLDKTVKPGFSVSMGKANENNRSSYKKLAIKAENVTELNMAIVIELVGHTSEREVGYGFDADGNVSLTPMSDWDEYESKTIVDPDESESPIYRVYYSDESGTVLVGDGTSYTDFHTSALSEGMIMESDLENYDGSSTRGWKVKKNITRIECYGAVSIDKKMDMINDGCSQSLTINLNGNILMQNAIFRTGATSIINSTNSLTVNNGCWYSLTSAAAGIQCRQGTDLTMNKVTYQSISGYLVRDEGGQIVFNGCELKSQSNFIYSATATVLTAKSDHRIVLNDTTLECGSSFFIAHNTTVEEHNYIDVYFMGKTSVKFAEGVDIITYGKYSDYPDYHIDGTYNFHVGNGVRLSTEGIITPASGTYENGDGTKVTCTYKVYYHRGMSLNDDGTVNAGTVLEADEYEINPTDSITYPYVVDLVLPYFVVYYKDGTTVESWENDLAAYFNTSRYNDNGVVKVVMYRDCVLSKNVNIGSSQELTLDLGGKTLNMSGGRFTMGSSAGSTAKILVKNGNITKTSGDGFCVRAATTLVFDGVTLDVNYVAWDCGANITFNNCTVNTTSYLFANRMSGELAERNIVFNDSKVTLGAYILWYNVDSDITLVENANVYLLGTSTLKTNSAVGYSATGSSSGKVTFYIEEGAKLSTEGFTVPESVTNSTITYNTVALKSAELDSSYAVVNVEKYNAFAYEALDNAYTVRQAYYTVYYADGTSKNFATSELSDAFTGSTASKDLGIRKVVLLDNATLSTQVTLPSNTELYIDLGGHKLTATQRFILGASGTYLTGKVTLANGEYEKYKSDGFCARYGTTLIFDNVTLNVNFVAWDCGANIIFNNCTVNASSYLVYNKMSGEITERNIIFNDSTVNLGSYILYYTEVSSALAENVNVYLLGSSTLTYPGVAVKYNTANAGSVTGNITFYVEAGANLSTNGFVTADGTDAFNVTYETVGLKSAELDSSYQVTNVESFEKFAFVASDISGYYTVATASNLAGIKSSLTLFSDFTINFYLPVEGNKITLVRINDDEYVIDENTETYTDTNGKVYYKLTVKNIAANKAAEDLNIVFVGEDFVENETFSVLRYCAIIFSNTKYKSTYALAASVVNYVNKAYDYSGNEKPALLTETLASAIYKRFLPETIIATDSKTEPGNSSIAIRSAQLDLGSSLKFRFNLASGYNGTVVIDGVTYTVSNGTYNGADNISISVRAYDMFDSKKCITLSGTASDGTEFSGTYDLRAYIAAQKADVNSTDELLNLLDAFYTYCAQAYSTKYGVVVENPDIGNTPVLDADINWQ